MSKTEEEESNHKSTPLVGPEHDGPEEASDDENQSVVVLKGLSSAQKRSAVCV